MRATLARWHDGWLREWRGVLAYCVIAAVLALTLYTNAKTSGQQQRALEQVARETHTALCTFTDDLERRLESTIKYLHKHPGREPIPGITRADLRRSVVNQKATLAALDELHCGR